MSLTSYTFLTAIILIVAGFILISNTSKIKEFIKNFPRSNKSSVVLLSIALFWFQYQHVRNLGEADFGDYKLVIGLIGCFIAISSYFFIQDFLSVRAFCILFLFYSREVLDAAFLQEPQSRLFLVSIIYFIITFSIYFGAWPFRMRDFLNWLYSKRLRHLLLGCSFLVYGSLLIGVALTY